ncbi:MAG TPA: MarC family protein [Deltaproteobacteria bacterium]|nr:MarC family protein [Deltaproteobacteria bacterium]HQB39601.1 MarC family protein [Deltaproteobacteria bacterium]
MEINPATILNATLAVLAIINPLGNLPIFVNMTSDLDRETRGRLFNLATMTGYVTLMILTFTGKLIMEKIFHIQISEFQIAGGVLLIVVAVRNILFPDHRISNKKGDNVMEIGIVPIAVPLMVGPGAIATGILMLNSSNWLVVLLSITLAFVVTWLVLRCSDFLMKLIGHIGSLVMSRILQIFIAAIGVHFLMSGIRALITSWK